MIAILCRKVFQDYFHQGQRQDPTMNTCAIVWRQKYRDRGGEAIFEMYGTRSWFVENIYNYQMFKILSDRFGSSWHFVKMEVLSY